jgi:hypothetical protein
MAHNHPESTTFDQAELTTTSSPQAAEREAGTPMSALLDVRTRRNPRGRADVRQLLHSGVLAQRRGHRWASVPTQRQVRCQGSRTSLLTPSASNRSRTLPSCFGVRSNRHEVLSSSTLKMIRAWSRDRPVEPMVRESNGSAAESLSSSRPGSRWAEDSSFALSQRRRTRPEAPPRDATRTHRLSREGTCRASTRWSHR